MDTRFLVNAIANTIGSKYTEPFIKRRQARRLNPNEQMECMLTDCNNKRVGNGSYCSSSHAKEHKSSKNKT